ncbi:ribokinase [Candidatus Arthromitus sp. SFB-rat-Yit]|uniref:ribokinase n=1 Tax=Candidatus Arthromitus sp. SFB-rat-Yit TaxID=1041504 RepID=UPI000227A090|nr:ribokinase [Candidatus Arthromitus sp. SFB-rat-Yit]BAK81821.1 ribokinase [Candidatus Arthromitus sp. SFB-rat-Yit]
MNKICVIGSLNMDLVLKINDIPKVGETILSKSYEKIAGGKGANQAIAAKRCGADVSMIAKIGKDENGKILREKLKEENIDVTCIFKDDQDPTGLALIMVNKNGNNSIVVVPGSNMNITDKEIDNSISKIINSDILIAQFETNENMTLKSFQKAKEFNKTTILNPAPAKKIDEKLLKLTDIIIPNETEAEILTGIKINSIDDAKKAGEFFLNKGVKFSVITLGEKGALIVGRNFHELVHAFKVNAVDTTAAGDSFIGALSSKLNFKNLNRETLKDAVSFGNKVSSITVQRKGAQPSIPYLEEIKKIYKEN